MPRPARSGTARPPGMPWSLLANPAGGAPGASTEDLPTGSYKARTRSQCGRDRDRRILDAMTRFLAKAAVALAIGGVLGAGTAAGFGIASAVSDPSPSP